MGLLPSLTCEGSLVCVGTKLAVWWEAEVTPGGGEIGKEPGEGSVGGAEIFHEVRCPGGFWVMSLWTPCTVDAMRRGHHAPWTPCTVDTMHRGHHALWTPCTVDTMHCGHRLLPQSGPYAL